MSLLYVSIVGALLENEAISGLSEGKPTGFRRTTSAEEVVWTPNDLIAIVSWTLSLMCYICYPLTQENGLSALGNT